MPKGIKGFQKGHPRYNDNTGKPNSPETRLKISLARRGIATRPKGSKLSEAHKLALRKKHKKFSDEGRRNISNGHKGSKSHLWKGGITPINHAIRNSVEYRIWRDGVFKRDNWTCIWCGIRGGKLNADHIQEFAYHPELRFAIDNGRTLCVPCHKKRHQKNMSSY